MSPRTIRTVLRLRRLHDARDGVTAVEFALIAPVLCLMVFGTIEMGLVMYAQNVLESSAFAASRIGKTGYADVESTRAETIRALLDKRAGALLDISRIEVDSKAYSQFDEIGDPEPFVDANHNGRRDTGENYTDINGNGQYDTDMGTAGVGEAGEVVVYTISYPWRVATPLIAPLLGDHGIVHLEARAVVQNEPYNED